MPTHSSTESAPIPLVSSLIRSTPSSPRSVTISVAPNSFASFGLSYFLCCSEPPCRCVPHHLLHDGFAAEHVCDHRGVDDAGAHGIDTSSFIRELQGRALREPKDAALLRSMRPVPVRRPNRRATSCFTITPLSCLRICCNWYFIPKKTPSRLMLMNLRYSSVARSGSSIAGLCTLALLNAASRRPNASTVAFAVACTCSSLLTSQEIAIALSSARIALSSLAAGLRPSAGELLAETAERGNRNRKVEINAELRQAHVSLDGLLR